MNDRYQLRKIDGTFRLFNSKKQSQRMANRFLEGIELKNLSKETVRAYGFDLLYLFRWMQKTKVVWKRFSEKEVAKFINAQHQLNVKPRTINRRLITCGLFYKFCFGKPIKFSRFINRPAPYYKREFDGNF